MESGRESPSGLGHSPNCLRAGRLRRLTSNARIAAFVVVLFIATATVASAVPILSVVSNVGASGDPANPFRYVYTLTNNSTCTPAPCVAEDLVEFAVPIFDANDFDRNSVIFTREDSFAFAPGPYFYDPSRDPVLAADPRVYGPNPGAFSTHFGGIDWRFNRTPLLAGETMTLEFNSAYGPTAAPYFAVWGLGVVPPRQFFETNSGVVLIPNSPAFQATQSVPEPSSLLLLAPAAIALLRRRHG